MAGACTKVNKLKVKKADGTMVTYTGSNGADMVRLLPYSLRMFQTVIPLPTGCTWPRWSNTQISEYLDKGYTLTQTPGW